MVATALRIAQPLLGRPVPMAVAAATVAAVAWWNAPLLIALPILAGVSVALMARFRA